MGSGAIVFGNCRYKVSDLLAAKDFYSKAFGSKPYFDEPTWVVFQIHDCQLWLEPDNLTEESVYETTNSFYKSSKQIKLTFWSVPDVQAICNQRTGWKPFQVTEKVWTFHSCYCGRSMGQ